jgi:hypothetical protein
MSNEQESLAWRFCVAPMMDWYENLELTRLSTLSRAPCAMHRTFFSTEASRTGHEYEWTKKVPGPDIVFL